MATQDHLIQLRRELHRHPEPAWREFYTTARIVEELRRIGVDELHIGPEALGPDRRGVPEQTDLEWWFDQAHDRDVDETVLAKLEGGYTGAVAVLKRGDGPTIGLRVDIDALEREESTDPSHTPTAEGFRAETPAMHACGHDAHTVIGIGVLEALSTGDFTGTVKVFFQPAEELVGGGKPLVDSGHLDDVDYLLSGHVGLDHPTGEIVAGFDGFLAIRHYRAEITGEAAHAATQPQRGRNAIQAAASAVTNLYGIPRHGGGKSRVNAGIVEGGSATNIIPERAVIEGEVRGETTEIIDYMGDRVDRIVESAATMHQCESAVETVVDAPSASSDPALASFIASVAETIEGVDSVVETAEFGASEDATFLMEHVQQQGGLASYIGIGTDHPTGHHTATFDVDEKSIRIGIDLLTDTIRKLSQRPPEAH